MAEILVSILLGLLSVTRVSLYPTKEAGIGHGPSESTNDLIHHISQLLRNVDERRATLQADPCLLKHPELTGVLSSIKETARCLNLRLNAMLAQRESFHGDVGIYDKTTVRQSVHSIRSAGELIEDIFNRIWLHLHLAYVRHSKHCEDGKNENTVRGKSGELEFPDWIDLRPVSILTDLGDQGALCALEGPKGGRATLALVLDPKCNAMEQAAAIWHNFLTIERNPRRETVSNKSDSQFHTRSLLENVSKKLSFEEEITHLGLQQVIEPSKILTFEADSAPEPVWLFSDLLEPAGVRPMFGHLLRNYEGCSSLHRARARALSRVDVVLELSQCKGDGAKTAGLGSLGTIRELNDCARWLISQSSSLSAGLANPKETWSKEIGSSVRIASCASDDGSGSIVWPPTWASLLPQDDTERLFAVRAAYSVVASIRPLTQSELCAVSTTRVRPEDPLWSWTPEYFFEVIKHIVEVGEGGTVRFKSKDLQRCLAENPKTALEAHAYMARVSFVHLQNMDQRIVIWPWSRYIELQKSADRHPLHDYFANFWQHHYRLAEAYVPEMPRQLHKMIEGVWLAERTELHQNGTGGEVNLAAYNEALDVGLILCEAYGFKKLESAYVNMGARDHKPGNKDVFDFSNWHRVEPFDSL